jgi:PAS domain S-box-containing protein
VTTADTGTTTPTRLPHSWGAAFVIFTAVAVVALAVVPLVMGNRAALAQRQIEEVLEPVRLLGTRLALVQARQMSLFQAFLLTGNPDFRTPYVAAVSEETAITAELQDLVQGMDLEIRERLARLSGMAGGWHLGHQFAFDSEEMRLQMVETFVAEQGRYEELQRATLDMERVIQAEVTAGRRRAEEQRRLQNRVSLGLLVLGLGATLAVAIVGRRLRVLTGEADARRRDAVRARRDMDAILEGTADGVLGIDLEGRVVTLNRAGVELLGYLEGELRGRDVHDTLLHTDREGRPRPRESSPILAALASGGAARSMGDVLWRKNGSEIPVQWSLRPLVDGFVVRGAVITFTDMTEILEKEDALRRAVRVREEVVSVVSHDLRNPLGVVTGAADILLELPLGEEERRSQVDIIRRSAQRMGSLVENLLDIARIEAGALVVRPAVLTPGEILEEAEAFFGPQARRKGIELQVEIEPGAPPVSADPDRIQQALANLLSNALKASPPGGTVTIGAHAQGTSGVALTVRDGGSGIDPKDLPHLFDRFWQASRHDRTGAGLGLAIVRGIAEAHGGSAEAASEPGKGALFTLVLPRAPGAASGGGAEPEREAP